MITLSGSNYPCLERISMIQKMFEPLRFDCNFKYLFATSVKCSDYKTLSFVRKLAKPGPTNHPMAPNGTPWHHKALHGTTWHQNIYIRRYCKKFCHWVRITLGEAVLTSTHNLCFEQKYEKYQKILSENFHFFGGKFFNIFEYACFRNVNTTSYLQRVSSFIIFIFCSLLIF